MIFADIKRNTRFYSRQQGGLHVAESDSSALLTILVVLLPILYQIVSPFPSLSLGELLLVPVVLVYLIKDFDKITLDWNLALFYLIPIGLTFIAFFIPNNYFDMAAFGRILARITLYFLLIIICARSIDIRLFVKMYIVIAAIASGVLLLQCFVHYCTNFELPVMRSFCEYMYEYPGSESLSGEEYYQTFGFRPAAFFTEPSYFTFYMVPLVIMLLFINDRRSPFPVWIAKRRIVIALFLTFVSLLSTSSASLLVLALTWVVYIASYIKRHKAKKGGLLIIASLICVSLVVAALVALGLFDVLIQRSIKGASLEHRVFRGFIIYDTLDPIHQLFGVGLNNHAAYIEANGIVTAYDEETVRFSAIADISNRLITSGAVGLVAMAGFVIAMFASSKSEVEKVFVIVLAVNFCFNWWQYSFRFAFMMIIIYLVKKWMKREVRDSG